jgi:hypothetical protein
MSLADLRLYLTQATERLVATPPAFGKPEVMRQARLEMQARCGSADTKDDDRVAQALAILRRDGPKIALASHCRWICWGLTKSTPGGPLLASKHLFPPTLDAIKEMHAAKALSASAWRGLVDGYLTPNPVLLTQAKENWLALRQFLSTSLSDIRSRSRALPDWLEQLASHPSLLADDPGAPFAADVLAGQRGRMEILREALTIGPESWFWEQLILAQVNLATSMPDQAFREVLDNVLSVAAEHPGIINDALIALLSRYHNGIAHEPHERLKAISVEKWGSPNLFTQATWNKVDPPVKRMVQEWLVREDLLDFFSILKDSAETDQRRLNFWMRYYKQMDWARLAFGDWVMNSDDSDTKELLKRRKGGYCSLRKGGANNAIVMKLGDYFFVEFSKIGNAAYGYRHDKLPFDITAEEISTWQMKQANYDFRESHARTSAFSTWEELYADRLADFGIFPDRPSPNTSASTFLGDTNSTSNIINDANLAHSEPSPTLNVGSWFADLQKLAKAYNLLVRDLRSEGGCIWVMIDRRSHRAADELRKLGFRYSTKRQAFWRID